MRILRITTTYLVSVILLGCASLLLLLPTYTAVQARAQAMRTHTQELHAEGALVSSADIEALQSRTKFLREKLTAKIGASPLLYIDIVIEHTMQGVRIVGFEIPTPEKYTMQVRGTAATRQALQTFITALQGDSRIAVVDSPITNFVKSAESEFNLTLTFVQP